MSAVAASEAAAAKEPGGPQGPTEMWLLTQRLDDIRRGQDELRAEMKEQIADLRRGQDGLRKDLSAEIASLRNWSLGLLLLAILGLLAKLLIPGV